MKIQKFCKLCGKEYYVSPYRKDITFYCSRSCSNKDVRGEHGNAWKGGKTELTCVACGKKYFLYPSQVEGSSYCSASCRSKDIDNHGSHSHWWKGGEKEYTCIKCDKKFFDRPGRDRKYCSPSCRSRDIDHYGEKSNFWQGGKSFEPYPPTFNNEFKRLIRERDNYTCAICNKYGKEVHHINYCKDDTTSKNCITLCVNCHGKTNHNRSYWIKYFSCL